MIEFVYNNAKNANISYTYFEFNYKYYSYIFYKKDFNSCSKLKIIKKQFFEV